LNTTSAGSPNPVETSRRGLLPLLLAVGAVALALFVGTQVIGVLYTIIFPPPPPRPEGVIELDHVNEAHGVDVWQYASSEDACSIIRFYEREGGTCNYAPDRCEEGFVDLSSVVPGENAGQCTGTLDFSIFALRWEAVIATGYRDENPTRFRLSREVFWTGDVPNAP
jgi:hypothetical protein